MKELFDKPASFEVVADTVEIKKPYAEMVPSLRPFMYTGGIATSYYRDQDVTNLTPTDALALLDFLAVNKEKIQQLAEASKTKKLAALAELTKRVLQ